MLSTLEENKEIALNVSRAILDGEWARLDGLLHPDFTYTGDGFLFTKDQYIGFMQEMRKAFSDMDMTFPHVVAEGDVVCIRFVTQAVNTGKFMGAPANRRNLEVNGQFIRQVRDGQVVQEWQSTDLLGVMKQIGFGALLGHAVFVGLLGIETPPPKRTDRPAAV